MVAIMRAVNKIHNPRVKGEAAKGIVKIVAKREKNKIVKVIYNSKS